MLENNDLVPVSELCRHPQKQQSVGTLPTPHSQLDTVDL